MNDLKPWHLDSFDLLKHAEQHRKDDGDFDRRMALISFDNSIESSIIIYLSLNPIQRKGRSFQKSDVEKWLYNFHTKIGFFEHFIVNILGKTMEIGRDEFIYFHGLRNELYHAGNGFVPRLKDIEGIRKAAFGVFSTLFEVDAETLIRTSHEDDQKDNNLNTLSAENSLLEAFISFKKEMNGYLGELKDVTLKKETNLAEVLQELLVNDTDILSKENLSLLEKVKTSIDRIIQGEKASEKENELRSITKSLKELNKKVDSRLKEFQIEIVSKALLATTFAIESKNRHIGIISQVAGTGLGKSLLSYVLGFKVNQTNNNFPIIIVSDSILVCDQIYDQFKEFISQQNSIIGFEDIVKVDNWKYTNDYFSDKKNKIIFTTLTQIRANNSNSIIETPCLIVVYNIHQSSPIILFELFQSGFFILFSSYFSVESQQLFGDVIGLYSLSEAQKEGNLSPFKVIKKEIEDFKNIIAGENKEGLLLLAEDILSDFSLRQKQFFGKGIIIIPNIKFGYNLLNEMLQIERQSGKEVGQNNRVEFVSSEHPDKQYLLKNFFHRENTFELLITTDTLINSYTNPFIHTVYLIKNIKNKPVIHQLISLVNKLYPEKESGVIVDYSNSFTNSSITML